MWVSRVGLAVQENRRPDRGQRFSSPAIRGHRGGRFSLDLSRGSGKACIFSDEKGVIRKGRYGAVEVKIPCLGFVVQQLLSRRRCGGLPICIDGRSGGLDWCKNIGKLLKGNGIHGWISWARGLGKGNHGGRGVVSFVCTVK